MDKKILGYWIATGLFCLAMLPGAVFSHLAVGDAVTEVIVPMVLLGVMAASYMLRPVSRR